MAYRLLLLIVMTFVISLAFPLSSVNAECCSVWDCEWDYGEEVEVWCYYDGDWYNCTYVPHKFLCETMDCFGGTCPASIEYDCLVAPTCGPLIFNIAPCDNNWVCYAGFKAELKYPARCDQEHCFFGSDCAYGEPECCTAAFNCPADP
jgi:hypothetical protein